MEYYLMTKKQLLSYCKKLYSKKGISALTYKEMPSKLYYALYSNNISQSKLIKLLDLHSEYKKYKNNLLIWNWKNIINECSIVVNKEGFLPPAQWFRDNGLGSMVTALYNSNKSWNDLREEFKSYSNSTFVKSRNNKRWLSHPEASLSNFLFVRGIKHNKGKRYPRDYEQLTGMKYGMYDLEFIDKKGKKVFVEVWGEKPNGHGEKLYAFKRKLKENYNKNKNFLGINFRDCYDEKKIEKILFPFIGKIKPFVFKKSYDKEIPSSNWSNADEIIEFCKEFAKKQPNGVFPTEEWLRKRGKWKNREGEAYNTLSIYIKKWIGGIRKLRKLIGQPENSTVKWSKQKVLKEYIKFYKKYNMTPGAVRTRCKRGKLTIPNKDRLFAQNLEHASLIYFKNTYDICRILKIKR